MIRCLFALTAALVVLPLHASETGTETQAPAPAAAAVDPAAASAPATGKGKDALGPVRTDPLATVLGKVVLPFPYRLQSSDITVSSNLGVHAYDEIKFVPQEGSLAGMTLRLRTSYGAPDRIEAGVVQGWVRSETERLASLAGTRDTRVLQLDGFGFTLFDTVQETKGKQSRVVHMIGSINGAMVNLVLVDPREGEDSADLMAVAESLKLDFPGMLRLRSRLEAESTNVVKAKHMQTPIGLFSEPKGLGARLSAASASYNGLGEISAATQTFGFYKMGFWTEQRMGMFVACDLDGGTDEEARATLRNPFDADDEKVKVVATPQGVRVGELPAHQLVAKRQNRNGLTSDVTRWYAQDGSTSYVVQIDRINGRALQLDLEKQMQAMRFQCKPESGLSWHADEAPAASGGNSPVAATGR